MRHESLELPARIWSLIFFVLLKAHRCVDWKVHTTSVWLQTICFEVEVSLEKFTSSLGSNIKKRPLFFFYLPHAAQSIPAASGTRLWWWWCMCQRGWCPRIGEPGPVTYYINKEHRKKSAVSLTKPGGMLSFKLEKESSRLVHILGISSTDFHSLRKALILAHVLGRSSTDFHSFKKAIIMAPRLIMQGKRWIDDPITVVTNYSILPSLQHLPHQSQSASEKGAHRLERRPCRLQPKR